MNILNNISANSLLIRTFTEPEMAVALSEFTEIPVHRILSTDPQFIQYAPFESGYDITITLTTCADLRYIAESSLLAELVVVSASGEIFQIGSEEGFALAGITPPPSPDKNIYVYTFKTQKPNNQPFKIRSYV